MRPAKVTQDKKYGGGVSSAHYHVQGSTSEAHSTHLQAGHRTSGEEGLQASIFIPLYPLLPLNFSLCIK